MSDFSEFRADAYSLVLELAEVPERYEQQVDVVSGDWLCTRIDHRYSLRGEKHDDVDAVLVRALLNEVVCSTGNHVDAFWVIEESQLICEEHKVFRWLWAHAQQTRSGQAAVDFLGNGLCRRDELVGHAPRKRSHIPTQLVADRDEAFLWDADHDRSWYLKLQQD